MSAIRFGLIFAALLLLCAQAAAGSPMVAIDSDTEWLVAGGPEASWISVQVADDAGTPVDRAEIAFSCDPALGALTPRTAKTGADGTARVRFSAGTTAGTAAITAVARWQEGGTAVTASAVCDQQIDHAAPQKIAALRYPGEITAGTTASILIMLTDRYGNPIDSRRAAETVRFVTGSPGTTAGVHDGAGYSGDVSLAVNESGWVTALFRADCIAGENIIYVDLPSPVADTYLTVRGTATGVPASISASASPASPIPADGASACRIVYTVKDRYGNPAGNRSLTITALPGEETTVRTNSFGTAAISYGPKDSAGAVTVTATAADNASVTVGVPVAFIHLDPSDMLLTANPQTMPSRDANPTIAATLRAKVIDQKGNPVAGETVSFSIRGDPRGASLNPASAVTDRDGYATVLFTPGAFPRPGEAGYDQASTASCTVEARWGGVVRSLPLTWKNYPFLSVTASVSPETVGVNETVSVNVTLRGDGWALQPRPIDAVLAIDCSGSMKDRIAGADTKMAAARAAARTFVARMNPSSDRIGLVPYYERSAPVQVGLSADYVAVVSTIDTLSPSGYTPTRLALKRAIDELIANPNLDPDAVRAVVLMSDGAYNYFGDPLARGNASSNHYLTSSDRGKDYRWYGYCNGTQYGLSSLPEDDLSAYARASGVRIYCISFGDGIVEGDNTYDTMTTLATSTGGFHEHAPDAAALSAVYSRIAGDLRDEAGVETLMDISMQEVTVNGQQIPGADVFDYQYIEGFSTAVENWIGNAAARYDLVAPYTLDQRDDWEDDHALHFEIGTVRLNQVWTARYTLTVKKAGNINLFGPDSLITFNGGGSTLTLPDTFVTAVPDLNNTGFGRATLDVADLRRKGSGQVDAFLEVSWALNYTGNAQATQRLSYSNDGEHTWVQFMTMPPAPPGLRAQEACLDVRNLPTGLYSVRVDASAPDTPDDRAELPSPILVGNGPPSKIRLE